MRRPSRLLFATALSALLSGTAFAQEHREPAHVLSFRTDAPGVKKPIDRWGVDLAYLDPANLQLAINYMGRDKIGLIRVSFPINQPLVEGELPAALDEHFTRRLKIIKDFGMQDLPLTMLPDSDKGVHPWFKNGRDVDPGRWVALMAAAQRKYGKKMLAIEPFNEADWGWGQGSMQNLGDIMTAMKQHPELKDALIFGPSTLGTDAANGWYAHLKPHVVEATTHALGGSFDGYTRFMRNAVADGKIAYNPEVHNIVEILAGVEHGMTRVTWWRTAEMTRGELCKASDGVRLAYAEDPRTWSAAAVYRSPSGKIQAFLGASERVGRTATYRFVCEDRPVYFDGEGPYQQYDVTIHKDQERVVNITWGDDVMPNVQGRYAIVNVHTGKALAIENANTDNNARAVQVQYTQAPSQQWDIQRTTNQIGDVSYLKILNVHSRRALDNAGWSQDEGNPIQQWGEGTAPPQQWFLDYAGKGEFRVRNRWSTKCLSVANASHDENAAIIQSEPTDHPAQRWKLIRIEGEARQ